MLESSNIVYWLVAYIKSYPRDDTLSLKRAWSSHVIHFTFMNSIPMCGTIEARVIKFCIRIDYVKC